MEHWSEVVFKVANFHKEKQEKFGIASSGKPKNGEKVGWGYRDTARSLGITYSTVAESIRLAAGLAQFPELAVIQNRDAALKSLAMLIKAESHKTFAEENRIVLDSVIIGNVLETIGQMPAESFDACYLKIRVADDCLIIPQIYRILRNESFFVIECRPDNYWAIKDLVDQTNFISQPYPIVVDGSIDIENSKYYFWQTRNLAHVCTKGSPYINGVNPGMDTCQALVIQAITVKGQTLLNPCSGRGEILRICKSLGVYSVGIESNLDVYLESDLVHNGEPNENPD